MGWLRRRVQQTCHAVAVRWSAWLDAVAIRNPHLIVIPINVASLIYFELSSDDVLQTILVHGKYLLPLNAYALGAVLREVVVKIRGQKIESDWECHAERDECGHIRRICGRVGTDHWTFDADAVWRR